VERGEGWFGEYGEMVGSFTCVCHVFRAATAPSILARVNIFCTRKALTRCSLHAKYAADTAPLRRLCITFCPALVSCRFLHTLSFHVSTTAMSRERECLNVLEPMPRLRTCAREREREEREEREERKREREREVIMNSSSS
jgi:hypothetical protein